MRNSAKVARAGRTNRGAAARRPRSHVRHAYRGRVAGRRNASGADLRTDASDGFADDRDYALDRYNNSNQYVLAVNDYAALLAADPAAFAGYYRWERLLRHDRP